MFYELAADTWGPEEFAAVDAVMKRRQYTMSTEVRTFEEEFAAWHGLSHGIMVNSGSSANLLAIAALFYTKNNRLQRGDEVLVPAIAWSTTYAPLQQYGLKVRFVDIAEDSLNVDVDALLSAITDRTKLIVAVSILGNPAALDRMRQVCDERRIWLVEDNCESLGAELDGKKAGSFGHLGTSSFFFSHHISTGEGGAVVTDDPELADLVRSLRAHGWTRDLPAESAIYERGEDDFFEAYRFILPGYNLRPMELQAAVGRVQLGRLDGFIQQRRKNQAVFKSLFQGDPRFEIQTENGRSSSFAFPLVLTEMVKTPRAKVFKALHEAGIAHRIITGGCYPRHDAVAHFDYETVGDLPRANRAHDRGLFVGNHPFDLTEQLQRFHEVLNKVCHV